MLFKILFVGAAATTGIFAGLWWAERNETENLNTRLEVAHKVYRRALGKMTVEQLHALLGELTNDHKFYDIVRNQ